MHPAHSIQWRHLACVRAYPSNKALDPHTRHEIQPLAPGAQDWGQRGLLPASQAVHLLRPEPVRVCFDNSRESAYYRCHHVSPSRVPFNRFTWDQRTNEDWYFCNMAADIFEDLPQEARPATFESGMNFSSEMIYSDRTFGVHQYWSNLSPASPHMRAMFDNCPEMWGIFPPGLLEREDWRTFVCATNTTDVILDPQRNVTFDFHDACNRT